MSARCLDDVSLRQSDISQMRKICLGKGLVAMRTTTVRTLLCQVGYLCVTARVIIVAMKATTVSRALGSTRMRAISRAMMSSRPRTVAGLSASRKGSGLTRKEKNKKDNASRRPQHQRQVLMEIAWLLDLSYISISAMVRHRGFYRTLTHYHEAIMVASKQKASSGLGRPL